MNNVFLFTKGPAFHVTANFYIIGFLTGWSYFSMSFDWLAAKVDCDWLSFGMWRVQKETLHMNYLSCLPAADISTNLSSAYL